MTTQEIIALLIFLLVVAAIYLPEAAVLTFFAVARLKHKRRTRILLKKPVLVLHFLALLGIICFLYGHFVEPYRIQVTTIPIRTDKLSQTAFRIVHISDLHCDKKMRNEKRLIEMINQLHPDVIVFTGDALKTVAALPLFKETFKNLKASSAKLAVRGNFETRSRSDLDLYSGTGFELLNAKTVPITKNGQTIYISGLSCDNPSAFKALLRPVPKENFSVFLYHYSDLIESVGDLNLDLYLCGHTHGGQVALPLYGAVVTLSKFGKKYEAGMYTVGGTVLYVNRGIGIAPLPAPQVRFCARPEITVFDIMPEASH